MTLKTSPHFVDLKPRRARPSPRRTPHAMGSLQVLAKARRARARNDARRQRAACPRPRRALVSHRQRPCRQGRAHPMSAARTVAIPRVDLQTQILMV